MSNENNVEKTKQLISTGSEIAGAAVGGAIGFFAAGPIGAAGAGSLGVVLAKAGAKLLGDIADRVMSDREKTRVGATAAIAFDKINKNNKAGLKPREDDFFSSKNGSRSQSEEILEGTLKKARDEYEEKKLEFLGNFYANVAYSSGVSVDEANYYLRLFDAITYRQLCIICLAFMKPYHIDFQNLRDRDYRTYNNSMLATKAILLQEVFELDKLGLVACRTNDGNGYSALLGWSDIVPSKMELTALGERFQSLFMCGGRLTLLDIDAVAAQLR
ncbi:MULTISPECIES: hypothetical protein [Aeromonas]|uniref:hypothetical protein n=1 Tax=Aeromonas TaxID=642 RepID=UPI0011176B06|nr:hypothetical protein [Aeromonas veronii]MBL0489325.1 hypothetical protein [Aeromonas veronii]MBL0503992.1 hypothetical protein [Aeromonas veronii]TNJ16060.1 hypothetical protein CF113_10485 [Aeromonas veronii]HDX8350858.1 hypothetical protein [Aeromonas veronii]